MTMPKTILRDAAIALLPLLGVGAWIGGGWWALGVLLAGLAALANAAFLGWLTSRFVSSAASTDGAGGGLAALGFLIKAPVILVVFGGLIWVFGPFPVGIGASSVVIALGVRAVVGGLRGESAVPVPVKESR